MKLAHSPVIAAALGLSLLTPAQATKVIVHHHSIVHHTSRTVMLYMLPTYRPGFTGGWYALNYHYYWGHAPLVNSEDPYDYNGNYFPPRR